MLDVEPFTSQGMSRRESSSSTGSEKDLKELGDVTKHLYYELVGIIVHSGQANAGHYYSFIKNRRYVALAFIFFDLYLTLTSTNKENCVII